VDSQAGDFNEDIFNEMNDNIKPLEDVDEIEVFATGDPILMHVIITSIQDSGIQSLGITVVVAGLILTILFIFEFRSFALGIMTLIPVILVICWIYGTMYLAGIPLNVFTIMVSTITIGIGVDYAIHITNRFMDSLNDYGTGDESLDSTIVTAGAALGGAAVTTVGGFLILYMAHAHPMRMFGSITALSITFSLIGSILILPAFLGLYAKRKLAKDPKYFEKHVDITAIRDHVSEHLHAFEKNLRKIGPIMIEANHQLAHKISDFGKEMEKAGKKIGEAAGKAGKQIEEGVKKAGDGVVKTSDKLGKKIDEVEEAIKKEFKKG
jgi:multidrug efflux pump subunit AcrB